MKKKLYKTIIQVEVLSEEPVIDDFCNNLSWIGYEIERGEMSGVITTLASNIEVEGEDAVRECNLHGTSTDFFMMDEDGNELNDY